jgi:hypothetical protein
VKQGDIVKVDLIGSAENSEFYYNIVETTDKAEIIAAITQVIMNRGDRWRSISTSGLFRAKENTTLKFSANFIKGDVSGSVKVAGLTLIAAVIGNQKRMNLALDKGAKASQSTTAYGGTADRAIDGNTEGNFFNRSVSHTDNKPDSWWQVELPSPAKIEKIVIWNRSDCCGKRLSNFRVSVLDASRKEIWSQYFKASVAQGGSELFKPDAPVKGRFVKIQIQRKNLEGNGVLSLAEVQVFGEFTK